MNIQLKLILFISLFSCIFNSIFAQKESYIWLGGKYPPTLNGVNQIIFSDTGIVKIDSVPHHGYMSRANSSYCNPETGELLIYTDGIHIFNGEYEIIENGDSLSPTSHAYKHYKKEEELGYYLGSPMGNSVVILPIGEAQLGIIHGYGGIYGITDSLFYTEIKINNGNKEHKENRLIVTKKNVVVSGSVKDYSASCWTKSVVRHANGRDWWIIIGHKTPPKNNGNNQKYYIFLLDTTGVHFSHTEIFSNTNSLVNNVEILMINKTGTMLASFSARRINIENGKIAIQLFNFNRCEGKMVLYGKLTFVTHIEYIDGVGGAMSGFCPPIFSPNGKYLYVILSTRIIQYPIQKDNWQLKGDTIGRWSEAIDKKDDVPLASCFGNARIGPDGKIYISASIDLTKYMHVIHNPNRRGDACDFEQNAIALPLVNKESIPFYVNYNLGPIDGSACDTLGLNNYVAAQFRYDILDEKEGKVYFIDLSDFNPTAWSWDFDDGNTSEERYPYHEYEEEGIYHVCLTASNMNGSDTYCRDVVIDNLTSTQAIEILKMKVYPNPVVDGVITLKNPENIRGEYAISTIRGEVVKTGTITGMMQQQLQLPGVVGVYLLSIESKNGVYSEKIVVKGK